MPETSRTIAFADCIDRLNAAIGRTVAWACLLVVVVQFAVVVMRYVFGLGSIWLTETIIYGHAALFMLAAAWTLREGGHVRVDMFYADAGAAAAGADRPLRRAAPAAAVHAGAAVVRAALCRALLGDPGDARAKPAACRWCILLKTLIPAFAVLMALQGIAQAIRAACCTLPSPGRASHDERISRMRPDAAARNSSPS